MTFVCTKCAWHGDVDTVPHLTNGGGLCNYSPIPIPEVDFPGLEAKLSPEDQAALDALNCPTCHLPGMKDGACVFADLHRSSEGK